MKYKIF